MTIDVNKKYMLTGGQIEDLASRLTLTGEEIADKAEKAQTGSTAPTTSTPGEIGQLYIQSDGTVYILKSIVEESGQPDEYTWEEVGAGTEYTAGDGIDITNDVISATNTGKAKELTTADYNWPENNPDGIAIWLLPAGIYASTSSLYYYTEASSKSNFSAGSLVVGKSINGSTNTGTYVVWNYGSQRYYNYWDNNGNPNYASWGLPIDIMVINSLTSSSNTSALSANQGRVLNVKIDSIAIRGAGAPTTSTGGTVGKLYEDTTNGKLYICTAVSGNTYTWEEVGESTTYTAGDGINISAQDVISATNTGKAKVLTADDYNYPTNNPDGVALWLLPRGLYTYNSPTKVYFDNTGYYPNQLRYKTFLVYGSAGGNVYALLFSDTAFNGNYYNRIFGVNESTGARFVDTGLAPVVNDTLTSTSTADALSANQGKILKDLIDAIVVPTKTSDLTNDGSDGTSTYVESNELATVATTGAYTDITGTPTNVSDFTNDAGYQTSSQVSTAIGVETTARQNADVNLQGQIDAIVASSDVKDIVGTKADLNNYDTTTLGNNDIIKVLADESQSGATTYYRWSVSGATFTLIGSEGPYYTKSQTDTLLNAKQNTLTAGSNVQIVNDTISATDTTYTAGTGLALNGTQFSVDTTAIATQSDLTAGLATKQDTLTAGSNIQINNNTISATDTTYSDFTGTDGTTAGAAGLVPAPATTDAGKFLKADGTWDTAGSAFTTNEWNALWA